MSGWVVAQVLSSDLGSPDQDTCVVLSTHTEKGDAVIAELIAEDQLGKPAVGGWVIGVDIARKPPAGCPPHMRAKNISWATGCGGAL